MFRYLRLVVFLIAGLAQASCFGLDRIDFLSVRKVDPGDPIAEGQSIISGSVRFIANGQPVQYTAFRRPIFRLLRREDFLYYTTPETDYDGNFFWSLPYGRYDVEILGNMVGYSPAGDIVWPPNPLGDYYRTIGFVRPGLSFTVSPGDISYLGTLLVDVNVSEENLLGDTIFKSLNRIRVVNDASRDPNWQKVRGRPNAAVNLFNRTSR